MLPPTLPPDSVNCECRSRSHGALNPYRSPGRHINPGERIVVNRLGIQRYRPGLKPDLSPQSVSRAVVVMVDRAIAILIDLDGNKMDLGVDV
jgi:hypothetical protein